MSKHLDSINGPSDVEPLELAVLSEVADEVRALIIDTVSKTGGHLAANLGVVELTLAMLKVFRPPVDKLVWDVSHQAYAYKILTGRRDRFATLRQHEGISGFLRRDESEHDAFGAGHSGTALSAALGMAAARDRRGSDEHVVAVLGDGSAGCGISLEALNNLAGTTRRFIVILNDNEMSIAANVGSMSSYLGRLLANPRYNRWKRSVESLATQMKLGWLRNGYYRVEEAIKGIFLRSIVFEEFGLRYIGPIDGHNLHALVDAMAIAKQSDRPIVLHVSTQKGKGYPFAEAYPEKWHGTASFDIATGDLTSPSLKPTYSRVFGDTMLRLAETDPRLVAITAAMPAGTGLTEFARRFPDRFFDVGISEEHAVVFAAGMATEDVVPVFAVYSTFAQRAVDCMIHDVCLQDLPVVLCLDRAGIVGDDGPTHHGVFDIALFRPVPGLTIMQPANEAELAQMLFTATRLGKPAVIRYPRGGGPGTPVPDKLEPLEIGKAEVIRSPLSPDTRTRHSSPVFLWALGDMIPLAEDAAARLEQEGIPAGVVNARFIRPLDEALLNEQARQASVIVTLENGVVTGGFGDGVQAALAAQDGRCRVIRCGWPDEFIPHGSPAKLMEQYGLTASAIVGRVRDAVRPA